MKKSKVILGSGLTALIAKKLFGNKASIVPLGPSRFYSQGVPGWGDDFIVHDEKVCEIVKEWGLDTTPMFFKRPFSISGSLIYGNQFIEHYLNRLKLPTDEMLKSYYKTNFTVMPFSCIQLWRALLKDCMPDIQSFYNDHKDAKGIVSINDHTIQLDNGDIVEYDQIISTIPYYVLCRYLKITDSNLYDDTYYYFIEDRKIDLEGADQALICDQEIPFHKCTKISNSKYLFEIIGEYYEDIYKLLVPILGGEFDILKAHLVEKGHVYHGAVNEQKLNDNDIICVGSYAQCDPLIDIGSVIKRLNNLISRKVL